MQLGTSIYMGGEPLLAENGSHEICKAWGITCPICKQPVFWNQGGVKKNGVTVRPFFSHYKAGGESPEECENRTAKMLEPSIIQSFAAEARGQRLKFFNRRFLEVWAEGIGEELHNSPKARRVWSDKEWTRSIITVQNLLGEDKARTQAAIVKVVDAVKEQASHFLQEELTIAGFVGDVSPQKVREHVQSLGNYFRNEGIDLHLKIASEAVDFLTTKKAAYAMKRLMVSSIEVFQIDRGQDFYNQSNAELIEAITGLVIGHIATCKWIWAFRNLK
jgi:hypothetical protein